MIIPTGLCVGLDPDPARIPACLGTGPAATTAFLTQVVSAARPFAAAFKINVAFFEQMGRPGIDALYATREAVGESFLILDAKRGDIGNTSAAYARSAFEDLGSDAITVSPYMGSDSIEPFLAYEDKLVYILALTSNVGSNDIQRIPVSGRPLYHHVMDTALTWQGPATKGFVVGATHADELAELRANHPNVPFLIPGLGAQGGDPTLTSAANAGGPALYNSSRGILYASSGEDFAEKAADAARELADLLTA